MFGINNLRIDSIMEQQFTNTFKRSLMETNNNLIQALELTLAKEPLLNRAYNEIVSDKLKVNYTEQAMRALDSDTTSKEDKALAEKYIKEFHGVSNVRNLDTASNPGGANVMQTSLVEVIFHRATEIDAIYPLVQKANFGADKTLEFPVFDRQIRATFITENSNVSSEAHTEFETATTGLTKRDLTQKTFAVDLKMSYLMKKSTSPTLLRQIINIVADGIARGRESQILNGAGGTNATGLILNAVTATAGADALETLTNGIGQLGGNNVKIRNLTIAMNSQAYAKFAALRAFNQPTYSLIGGFGNPSIQDVKVVITNELLTTAGSTTVVLGDFEHYVWAQTSNGELLENNPANNANLENRMVFATTADGEPLFDNSFAKFTLTV